MQGGRGSGEEGRWRGRGGRNLLGRTVLVLVCKTITIWVHK